MISWLDDVLGITSTILSLGVLGPAGMAAGAGVGTLAKTLKAKEDKTNAEREEMIRSWASFALSINKLKSLDNVARWKMLTEAITVDLTARTGKPPKERQVHAYAQLVVNAIKGDFQEADTVGDDEDQPMKGE